MVGRKYGWEKPCRDKEIPETGLVVIHANSVISRLTTKPLHQFRTYICQAALILALLFPAIRVTATGYGVAVQDTFAGLPIVSRFEGLWHTETGLEMVVPFMDFKARELDIFRGFTLAEYEQLPDTLSLYLFGVSRTAEVWVNDRLLGILEDPYGERVFPVAKSWLQVRDNLLKLKLTKAGINRKNYPKPFVGVIGQVVLLGGKYQNKPPGIPFEQTADTALGLAWWPWSGSFSLQERDWLIALNEIHQSGVHTLYLPFMPSRSALDQVEKLNFTLIDRPAAAKNFAWYREYPHGNGVKLDTLQVWRDESGAITPDYGNYSPGKNEGKRPLGRPDQAALLIILLLPWLGLLALKLGIPRIYDSLFEFLTKSNLQFDLINEDKFLKAGQSFVMLLLRLITLSAFLSTYLYFLQIHGDGQRFDFISEDSLLHGLAFGVKPGLMRIFLIILAWASMLSLIKYGFLTAIGLVYRYYNLATITRDIDSVGAFPANLGLCIPPALLFFTEGITIEVVWIVWQVFIVLYYIRRLVLIFQGFNRLVPFSSHIKILYICALEILPWVILI